MHVPSLFHAPQLTSLQEVEEHTGTAIHLWIDYCYVPTGCGALGLVSSHQPLPQLLPKLLPQSSGSPSCRRAGLQEEEQAAEKQESEQF